jgi:succinyl-CoA synthetase beta subunit
MVSREGGVDIEEVAATNPEAIVRLAVDPRYGLLPFQAYNLATALYDDVKQQRAAAKIMQQLYAAFMASGASLAEINPLVTTPDGADLLEIAPEASCTTHRQRKSLCMRGGNSVDVRGAVVDLAQ